MCVDGFGCVCVCVCRWVWLRVCVYVYVCVDGLGCVFVCMCVCGRGDHSGAANMMVVLGHCVFARLQQLTQLLISK